MFIALALLATAAAPQNPLIDYAGFQTLTTEVRGQRQARLISLSRFQEMAKGRKALILDARSAEAFKAGHIAGAVNLPFTDFTAESLAQFIGKPDRPVLIYCNNNFINDVAPVRMKARPLALNIQTFINLVGYGYKNVWELGEKVDMNDPEVAWVRGG
jgi:phage shock protein E